MHRKQYQGSELEKHITSLMQDVAKIKKQFPNKAKEARKNSAIDYAVQTVDTLTTMLKFLHETALPVFNKNNIPGTGNFAAWIWELKGLTFNYVLSIAGSLKYDARSLIASEIKQNKEKKLSEMDFASIKSKISTRLQTLTEASNGGIKLPLEQIKELILNILSTIDNSTFQQYEDFVQDNKQLTSTNERLKGFFYEQIEKTLKQRKMLSYGIFITDEMTYELVVKLILLIDRLPETLTDLISHINYHGTIKSILKNISLFNPLFELAQPAYEISEKQVPLVFKIKKNGIEKEDFDVVAFYQEFKKTLKAQLLNEMVRYLTANIKDTAANVKRATNDLISDAINYVSKLTNKDEIDKIKKRFESGGLIVNDILLTEEMADKVAAAINDDVAFMNCNKQALPVFYIKHTNNEIIIVDVRAAFNEAFAKAYQNVVATVTTDPLPPSPAASATSSNTQASEFKLEIYTGIVEVLTAYKRESDDLFDTFSATLVQKQVRLQPIKDGAKSSDGAEQEVIRLCEEQIRNLKSKVSIFKENADNLNIILPLSAAFIALVQKIQDPTVAAEQKLALLVSFKDGQYNELQAQIGKFLKHLISQKNTEDVNIEACEKVAALTGGFLNKAILHYTNQDLADKKPAADVFKALVQNQRAIINPLKGKQKSADEFALLKAAQASIATGYQAFLKTQGSTQHYLVECKTLHEQFMTDIVTDLVNDKTREFDDVYDATFIANDLVTKYQQLKAIVTTLPTIKKHSLKELRDELEKLDTQYPAMYLQPLLEDLDGVFLPGKASDVESSVPAIIANCVNDYCDHSQKLMREARNNKEMSRAKIAERMGLDAQKFLKTFFVGDLKLKTKADWARFETVVGSIFHSHESVVDDPRSPRGLLIKNILFACTIVGAMMMAYKSIKQKKLVGMFTETTLRKRINTIDVNMQKIMQRYM